MDEVLELLVDRAADQNLGIALRARQRGVHALEQREHLDQRRALVFVDVVPQRALVVGRFAADVVDVGAPVAEDVGYEIRGHVTPQMS